MRVAAEIGDPVFAYGAEKICPSQLGFSSNDAKSLWLRVLFTDEAGKIAVARVSLGFC